MACELPRTLASVARQKSRVSVTRSSLVKRSRLSTYRHLSSRRHNTRDSISDFLLPAFTSRYNVPATTIYSQRLRPAQPPSRDPRTCRGFSVSSRAQATVVTANPRMDEEGNEMLIDITSRAANRLKEIMSKDSNPDLALRVTVESGGCHGFQYLMSLTKISAVSPEEDTIFEASDGSGAKVVMDEPSLELLKGSTVEFTMELIGSQFMIVGNPAATSSCGCGTSFDIKP